MAKIANLYFENAEEIRSALPHCQVLGDFEVTIANVDKIIREQGASGLAKESLEILKQTLHLDESHRIITVIGDHLEDAYVILLHFAGNLALDNKKMLIMNCAKPEANLGKLLGVREDKGLSDILLWGTDLNECLQPSYLSSCDYLALGSHPLIPQQQFKSWRFKQLIRQCRQQYDYTLLIINKDLYLTEFGEISSDFLYVHSLGAISREEFLQSVKKYCRYYSDKMKIISLISRELERKKLFSGLRPKRFLADKKWIYYIFIIIVILILFYFTGILPKSISLFMHSLFSQFSQ